MRRSFGRRTCSSPRGRCRSDALRSNQLELIILRETIMQRAYRIGQIVPSSNTTMETEIPAMLHARAGVEPEQFTFHSSRMRMHKVTPEELVKMNKEGIRCAAELADARV